MTGSRYHLFFLPVFLVAVTGCLHGQNRPTTSDIQMRQMDKTIASFGGYFTDMADNALLSDMALADIHFIPHSTEISGVGEVKLGRLAKLLNTYGGTVRYETSLEDEALVQGRMDHIHEYLALSGCNMSRVDVAVMLPGKQDMPGHEAVEKYHRGTVMPDTASTSGTMTLGGSGASQSPGR